MAGEKAVLELVSGGRLELSLLRVERVVDDEVERGERAGDRAGAAGLALRPALLARPGPAADALRIRRSRLPGSATTSTRRLLAAVVAAESGFRERVTSDKGARGLMQLMPATALRFGVAPRELFEPARNLEAGARYLRWLLDRYDGRLHLALAAYNAGEGAVDRFGGVPPYRETRRYVRRVYALFGIGGSSGR